jgi:hypothetical protein
MGNDKNKGFAELILLTSSYGSGNIHQTTNQERARTILKGLRLLLSSKNSNSSLSIREVDGADPTNTQLRTDLFEVSGVRRGYYPQLFLRLEVDDDDDDRYEYIGSFDEIEMYNENNTLSEKILSFVVPSVI